MRIPIIHAIIFIAFSVSGWALGIDFFTWNPALIAYAVLLTGILISAFFYLNRFWPWRR